MTGWQQREASITGDEDISTSFEPVVDRLFNQYRHVIVTRSIRVVLDFCAPIHHLCGFCSLQISSPLHSSLQLEAWLLPHIPERTYKQTCLAPASPTSSVAPS